MQAAPGSSNTLSRPSLAVLLLLLALGLAAAVALSWRGMVERHEAQQRHQFDADSQRLKARLDERMRAYTEILRATAGLFTASTGVSRTEFEDFIEALDLGVVYPGIQGVGYSRLISPDALDAHVAEVRAEGFPQYVVWPPGPRDVYSAIVYLEPFSGRNLRAFGYDMYSEPTRRLAMAHARDTGSVGITHPVKLLQETSTDVQVGVLAYHAVYRPGAVLQTLEQRRAAHVGWAYSPYRMTDLMEGIFHDDLRDVRLELFDGRGEGARALLYDSGSAGALAEGSALTWTGTTEIDGHFWTLRFTALPSYASSSNGAPPWWALVGMSVIGLLLLVSVGTWLSTSGRASDIAAHLTASLRESEDRYRSVVDHLDDVVFQTDREGRFSFLNGAWSAVTGRAVASSIGQPLLDVIHPGDRGRIEDHLRALLSSTRESFEDEARLAGDRDNPGRWVSLYARATVTSTGLVGLSGTLTDISERKQAEAATNAARDAAEAANRSKSLFLATMSHEIRTPMNGVMGTAEVLLGTKLDDDQRALTRTVIDSTEALLVVINDILDYSKVESGRLQLERSALELRVVLGDVVRLLDAQASARGLSLRLDVADDVPRWLLGDAVRLRQVLINLVGNALKFTAAGAVTIGVTRAPPREGRPMLRIAVSDTGIGMSEEVQGRLFTPFQQGDETVARRFGGTGLGLTISRQLVEMMGGDIAVQSALGRGSTFTVTVPCEESGPRQQPTPLPTLAIPPRKRALVVDDNATNQLVLSRLLLRLGVESKLAADGQESLALLQHESFDVVLMDLQMPQMDGEEAARRIRAGEVGAALQQVPIIALSADAMESTRARCAEAGMNDFIAKPVHLDELHACLGRWLDERLADAARLH